MTDLTTSSKISKFIKGTITSRLKNWTEMLLDGDLQAYELELSKAMTATYDFICEELLPITSGQMLDKLVDKGKATGGRKITLRPFSFRIATGRQIEVESPYVRQPGKDWVGSRHLLANHWGIIGGATPAFYDKVGYCAALGPSYDIANQTLSKFGVTLCTSSVRGLTNRLANHCFDYGEENLMLEPQETLAGKRVVISIDGGRTRTRTYSGTVNEAGQLTYKTAWNEPKLFVIDVLNEDGQPDRHELPIYGCRFAEADVLELLERYLKRLEIDKAEQVQILADGAPWIWNNMKAMLLGLKVAPDRIIESLDYYHASQYVYDLIDHMPKRISSKQRNAYIKQFKDWLWEGSVDRIIQECNSIYKRPSQLIKRWINYLDKHRDKTQYAVYEENKLMCGSGIIESAIRRIINLRFKNASTFWEKETVEKLYFLRAALLSKRWDLVMKNISKST
jgi:hypothetical protein